MRLEVHQVPDRDETVYTLRIDGYDRQRAYGAADRLTRLMWLEPAKKVSDHLQDVTEIARILERLAEREVRP